MTDVSQSKYFTCYFEGNHHKLGLHILVKCEAQRPSYQLVPSHCARLHHFDDELFSAPRHKSACCWRKQHCRRRGHDADASWMMAAGGHQRESDGAAEKLADPR